MNGVFIKPIIYFFKTIAFQKVTGADNFTFCVSGYNLPIGFKFKKHDIHRIMNTCALLFSIRLVLTIQFGFDLFFVNSHRSMHVGHLDV